MRRVSIVALSAFALALAAAELPDAADLERNRAKLEKWKAQPEHYARLKRHAQSFQALPAERREQLIKLDEDLAGEPAGVQARLGQTMERYEQWLEALDAKDRQRIVEAAGRNERLAVIQEIRDREFLQTQPQVVRDKAAKLEGKERSELIRELRAEERRTKKEWLIASRFWTQLQTGTPPLPARLSDFGKDVQTYYEGYLSHFLSEEETARLKRAEGHWPLFPITLVELADKHPAALPGPHVHRRFEDLPAEVQKIFKGKLPKLVKKEGPDYPKWLTAATPPKTVGFPNELYAWNEQCLSKEMKAFVDKMFKTVLNEDEKRLLNTSTNKWPDYPKAIQDLAQAYALDPPWFVLPPSRKQWDVYRFKK